MIGSLQARLPRVKQRESGHLTKVKKVNVRQRGSQKFAGGEFALMIGSLERGQTSNLELKGRSCSVRKSMSGCKQSNINQSIRWVAAKKENMN